MSSVAHYNGTALNAPTECASLRSSHRAAKHAYIKHAVDMTGRELAQCHIIDFACGRGGDLPKCRGCASYVGVDNAEHAVAELERRAAQMNMCVRTHVSDACDVPSTPCTLALCNFAVHYFCDNKAHLVRLVRKVAACLNSNGVFCGTCERVPRPANAFGVARHVVIGDCVNAMEWEVPHQKFFQIAQDHGLALVWYAPLAWYDKNAEKGIWVFIMRQKQGSDHQSRDTKLTS